MFQFFLNFGNHVTSELYAATRVTETTCAEIHTFAISDTVTTHKSLTESGCPKMEDCVYCGEQRIKPREQLKFWHTPFPSEHLNSTAVQQPSSTESNTSARRLSKATEP
jgi:hypothetical protein